MTENFKQQIKDDIVSSFELCQTLMDENKQLFNNSPSFVSFLFTLCDIQPSFSCEKPKEPNEFQRENEMKLQRELELCKENKMKLQKELELCEENKIKLQQKFYQHEMNMKKEHLDEITKIKARLQKEIELQRECHDKIIRLKSNEEKENHCLTSEMTRLKANEEQLQKEKQVFMQEIDEMKRQYNILIGQGKLEVDNYQIALNNTEIQNNNLTQKLNDQSQTVSAYERMISHFNSLIQSSESTCSEWEIIQKLTLVLNFYGEIKHDMEEMLQVKLDNDTLKKYITYLFTNLKQRVRLSLEPQDSFNEIIDSIMHPQHQAIDFPSEQNEELVVCHEEESRSKRELSVCRDDLARLRTVRVEEELQFKKELEDCRDEITKQKTIRGTEEAQFKKELENCKDKITKQKTVRRTEESRFKKELEGCRDEITRQKTAHQDEITRQKTTHQDEELRFKKELEDYRDKITRQKTESIDEELRSKKDLAICQVEKHTLVEELAVCRVEIARAKNELINCQHEITRQKNELMTCQGIKHDEEAYSLATQKNELLGHYNKQVDELNSKISEQWDKLEISRKHEQNLANQNNNLTQNVENLNKKYQAEIQMLNLDRDQLKLQISTLTSNYSEKIKTCDDSLSECQTQLNKSKTTIFEQSNQLKEQLNKYERDLNKKDLIIKDLSNKKPERGMMKRKRALKSPSKSSPEKVQQGKKFAFSEPNVMEFEMESSYIEDEHQDLLGHDDMFIDLQEELDKANETLKRCILQKDALTEDNQKCKKKLKNYEQSIQSLNYLDHKDTTVSIKIKTMKILFIQFYIHHFKLVHDMIQGRQITVYDEITSQLTELLNQLKVKNDEYENTLLHYIMQQISIFKTQNEVIEQNLGDIEECKTINELLIFAVSQSEIAVKAIEVPHELNRYLEEIFRKGPSTDTYQSLSETVASIIFKLREIFTVNGYVDLYKKVNDFVNLVLYHYNKTKIQINSSEKFTTEQFIVSLFKNFSTMSSP